MVRRVVRGLGLDEITRFQRLHDIDNILERIADFLGITSRLARDLERVHTGKLGLDRFDVMVRGPRYRRIQYTLKVIFQEALLQGCVREPAMQAIRIVALAVSGALENKRPEKRGKPWGEAPWR